jgi:cobalt-zinc-cadmium efflux system protein
MLNMAHHHHAHGHAHSHSHGHSHGHAHAHSHIPAIFDRTFAIGIALNLAFVAIEGGSGVWSNSMVLVADAGHNLSDVLSLALAWFASRLVRKRLNASARRRYTYGFRKSSVLAALVNAVLLLVACGGIAWEALGRLRDTAPVAGSVVIWVAAIGVVINTATALLFMRGREHDANIKGAFLHMAADAAVSLGVVISGVVIAQTGWFWLDPAMSLVIVAVVVYGTWGLLTGALTMALDAVPHDVDIAVVREYLSGLEGVASVHDLHVWALSTTETALTAHVVLCEGYHLPTPNTFLHDVAHVLEERFTIHHATLQLEVADDGAAGCHQDCEG